MELRHLRYFAAVAEERHFGRAAERLGIAQPPLSKQLQDLERELGYALFDRSHRPIALTAAGETLLEHARGILEAVEIGLREARRAGAGHSGTIAIGYPPSLAYSGLTQVLRAFRESSPDVAIQLLELAPAEQIAALKRGDLDVAFVRTDRLPPRAARRRSLELAPDLAVEVVSPTESRQEIEDKVAKYLDGGVPMVVLLYPTRKVVAVHRPDREPTILGIGDVLDGEEIVPGFRIAVADLFRDEP